MNPSSPSSLLKSKRESFRVEIRKSDLLNRMDQKRFPPSSFISNPSSLPPSSSSLPSISSLSPTSLLPPSIVSEIDSFGAKNAQSVINAVMGYLIDADFKGNYMEILGFLKILRSLSTNKTYTPGKELLQSGIVRYLEGYLGGGREEIVVESVWIMCNIVSSKDVKTEFVFEGKLAMKLLQLLDPRSLEIYYNVVWTLGNISGDNLESRNSLISLGIIDILVESSNYLIPSSLTTSALPNEVLVALRETSWVMSNVCRGKPYPAYSLVFPFLEIFIKMIFLNDMQMNENALWGLHYLTDSENYKIKNLLKFQEIIPLILSLSVHSDLVIKSPALRILGNICLSDDSDVLLLIEKGIFEVIETSLQSKNRFVRRDASWMLANILAGGEDVIDQFLKMEERIAIVKDKVLHDENVIRVELVIALSNLTINANLAQIIHMIDHDLIYILITCLEIGDNRTILAILDAIENLLKYNQINDLQESNTIFKRLESYECGKVVEALQKHPDKSVYLKSMFLIEKYYDFE